VEPVFGGEIGELFASYARHLHGLRRSDRTIESYREAVTKLIVFADTDRVDDITPDVVRRWLGHEQDTTSPGSVGIRYRSVRAFLNWLEAEGEIERSPMRGIPHPAQPDTPVPILELDEVQKLLAVTNGNDWRSRRDRALVMFMLDTGCRRGEVAGVKIGDVDLDRGEVVVSGKTGTRRVSLGVTAVAAVDKWLRARRRLKPAQRTEALWVGDKGAISAEGVRQILKRLGGEAGVKVAPHQLRHTTSHVLRAAGMGDAEMMELLGWRSAAMLQRYGRSAVGARAREQHKRISPADQL
jgi:site-specific recombinase XerD